MLLKISPSLDGPLEPNTSSMSGAMERDNVLCGYSLQRGRRPGMEDYLYTEFATHCSSGEKVGLFGVFDGHGGPDAADFVKTNLMQTILANQKFPADLEGAVTDSYLSTDAAYLRQESGTKHEDGCTAVTAVLYQHRLVVANVGDSRAVLCRGGKAIALSMDHKPNHREERERIEAAGGMVVWAGTWRVGGVLAVSRAFGDKPLKRYVTSMPHVRIESLQKDDEFLILASDGLWDVVSNEDAIQLVRSMIDPEEAAKHLSQEAMKRGSCDNISCIVLRFKN